MSNTEWKQFTQLFTKVASIDLAAITSKHVLIVHTVDLPFGLTPGELQPLLKRLPTGCLVIFTKSGEEISALNQNTMNMNGWFDGDQLAESHVEVETAKKLLRVAKWSEERISKQLRIPMPAKKLVEPLEIKK